MLYDTTPQASRAPRRPRPPTRCFERAQALYADDYAERYESLYVDAWPRKHALNVERLDALLDELPRAQPHWLDLACGPAWHFRQFEGRARMVGLDASRAQLARARRHTHQAIFVCADMVRAPFAPASFDLVTSFWGAYCYLDNRTRIGALVDDAVGWLRPGGALYLEVLLGRDLADFNRSSFARRTGFEVVARTPDHGRWYYEDSAGEHRMTSPDLDFFLDRIRPRFASVEAEHDGAFMVHLIARGRLEEVAQ